MRNILCAGEEFRFGTNPLLQFHEHLKAGHYSPDIAKMRQMIRKAEEMEAKQRYRSFKQRLKRDVLESRRKLLNVVRNLPPGVEPKVSGNFKFVCDVIVSVINVIVDKTTFVGRITPSSEFLPTMH